MRPNLSDQGETTREVMKVNECSFCAKPQDEAVLIITSPQGRLPVRYICDHCVEVCLAIIGTKPAKPVIVDNDVTCSFCFKPWGAIETLLVSPPEAVHTAYICDECVRVCDSILADSKPALGTSSARPAARAGKNIAETAPSRLGPVLVARRLVPFHGSRSLAFMFGHTWRSPRQACP